MNYLAHLALSPDNDAIRIGNLLGDFIKGNEESLRSQMPAELVNGILLHRAIDKFTDAHPAFLASKTLLAPERRRYAGVVIDLIYDHFLSIHWREYYQQPLSEFIEEIYVSIASHPDWQLGTLKQAFPYMCSQDWLGSYISIDGINTTFRRVSYRSKYTTPIADTHLDLANHYHEFENHFKDIYPDLIRFSDQYVSQIMPE